MSGRAAVASSRIDQDTQPANCKTVLCASALGRRGSQLTTNYRLLPSGLIDKTRNTNENDAAFVVPLPGRRSAHRDPDS